MLIRSDCILQTEEFNVWDTALSMNIQNVVVNLPANLYTASSHQPKVPAPLTSVVLSFLTSAVHLQLRFFEFQMELRSVLTYTDL
jgi:hypothetical protein